METDQAWAASLRRTRHIGDFRAWKDHDPYQKTFDRHGVKGMKHEEEWKKAKKLCRLSNDDIRMARELGMGPRGLIKNIPSPSQRWKAPVAVWVRGLYEKKFGKKAIPPPLAPRIMSSPSSRPDDLIERDASTQDGDGDDSFDIPF
jgi:hypothetical protein